MVQLAQVKARGLRPHPEQDRRAQHARKRADRQCTGYEPTYMRCSGCHFRPPDIWLIPRRCRDAAAIQAVVRGVAGILLPTTMHLHTLDCRDDRYGHAEVSPAHNPTALQGSAIPCTASRYCAFLFALHVRWIVCRS